MKRLLFVIGVAGLLISGVAAPAGAGDVASYIVALDGASEVPGPGDPDGSGTVTLQLGTVSNDVCVSEITLDDIDEPLAMHIHEGGAGVEGGIVVDLSAALSAVPSCATVSAALMAELITRPECYYVNVHTEPFPAGAIRGQLVDGPCDDEPTTTVTTEQVTPTTAATATAARPTFTG